MVLANPPLAEPVTDPGGVINKPPFEMGVANLEYDTVRHYKSNAMKELRGKVGIDAEKE